MALSNQPYLPLFVRDWLTSKKLAMCSPAAHGILINFMCWAHMEDDYGVILLKQKFKQTSKQVENFALQLAKVLPFDMLEILPGLQELVNEKCLIIEGDNLICRRMVKDADISSKRANSGKNGGKKTQSKNRKIASHFAKANNKANTEYEIEYVNDIENKNEYVRDEVFEKKILEFFGFNEIKNFNQFRLLSECCRSLHNQNQLEYFRDQSEFYMKYKTITGHIHNFNTFLGEQSELFQNGAWQAENWQQKLSVIKTTPNGEKKEHPDYWDIKHYQSLSGQKLSAYYSHLRGLGWNPVKDRVGNLIEFVKTSA